MDTFVLIEMGDWNRVQYVYAARTAHTWCISNLANEVKLLNRARTRTDSGPYYLVFKTPEEAVQFKLSVDRTMMLEGYYD